jgi:hypothetical protein
LLRISIIGNALRLESADAKGAQANERGAVVITGFDVIGKSRSPQARCPIVGSGRVKQAASSQNLLIWLHDDMTA